MYVARVMSAGICPEEKQEGRVETDGGDDDACDHPSDQILTSSWLLLGVRKPACSFFFFFSSLGVFVLVFCFVPTDVVFVAPRRSRCELQAFRTGWAFVGSRASRRGGV